MGKRLNKRMEVLRKRISDCVEEMEIKVPVDRVKNEVQNLIFAYQATVQVEGFRKGRVPPQIIYQKFGKEIQQKAINNVVQDAYQKALQKEKISPLTQAEIKELKFDEKEGLKFKVRYEIMPEFDIDEKDYKGIEVKVPPKDVREEEIEREIMNLREQYAQYFPVMTRGAKEGDMIICDLEFYGKEKGIYRPQKVDNYAFIVGDKKIAPELSQAVIGKMPGDNVKVNVGGTEYSVKIKEIKEKRLLQSDDELAKEIGYNNFEELREDVRKRLEQRKEHQFRQNAVREIIDKLIEKTKFEPPPSIVKIYEDDFKEQGYPEDKIKELSVWNARKRLILDKIAQKEKIELTEEEFEEKLKEWAEEEGKTLQELKREIRQKGLESAARSYFIREKVIDFLIENAKISYV